jgi:predicted nucleic acid-binding protein
MENEHRFVDTNLFLRYLTNDVPEQADAVEELLHKAANGEVTLLTNSLVIAEIVWTLESFYRLERTDIKEKVVAILNTPGLKVVDADLVLQAITGYVEKNVDFIDAYNVAWMLSHGITSAYTFDRKHFNRFDGITVHIPEKTPDDT